MFPGARVLGFGQARAAATVRATIILWGKDSLMIRLKNVSATLVAAAAMGLSAVPAAADGHHGHRPGAVAHVITVSCYRGPWDDVIWDRPNPVFLDSLVAAGYSFPEAHAIAERVCRDPSAVGQTGVLTDTMQGILRTSPPGS